MKVWVSSALKSANQNAGIEFSASKRFGQTWKGEWSSFSRTSLAVLPIDVAEANRVPAIVFSRTNLFPSRPTTPVRRN